MCPGLIRFAKGPPGVLRVPQGPPGFPQLCPGFLMVPEGALGVVKGSPGSPGFVRVERIPQGSLGSQWFPKAPQVSSVFHRLPQWFPMFRQGSTRFLMFPQGFPRLPKARPAFHNVPQSSLGSFCVFGCLSSHEVAQGYTGYRRIPQGPRGFPIVP